MISLFDLTKPGGDRKSLEGHAHNIPALSISPDDRYIASTSIDNTLMVWDVSKGRPVKMSKKGNEWGWGVLWVNRSSMHFGERREGMGVPVTREDEGFIRALRNYVLRFQRVEENEEGEEMKSGSEDDSSDMELGDESQRERARSEGKVEKKLLLEEEKKKPVEVNRRKADDLVIVQTTKTFMNILDPELKNRNSSCILLKHHQDLILAETLSPGTRTQHTIQFLLYSRFCLQHYVEMFGLLILGNNLGNTIQVWQMEYSLE
eukprot:TRINITY_DN15767_c0_g2_i1.p1 TRINITY_DN15767_c0_g2~~TRINITY_DN15767_c0_g2_i1.p1  ORF type:complete len:262 (+),score=55.67 TRINITY_DN15767_c0_g2_i1:662-1447(+)